MKQNDKPLARSPPNSTAVQYINHLLHQEPMSDVFRGLFWWFVLAVVSPIIGAGLLFYTLCRCVTYTFFYFGFLRSDDTSVLTAAKERNHDLAVYITGCDSGFGKDLATQLAADGYFVFAGCLTADGIHSYDGIERVTPLQADVTKEDQVLQAASVVTDWLQDSSAEKPRFLHAVINNAGCGAGGFVDWVDLHLFQRDMEVNYFGMIRTSKAFLPILKTQAMAGTHQGTRVINMVSVAGLANGGAMSSYHGSKHAAESFSACLRSELKAFGISVITVNPTFHQTPIVDGAGNNMTSSWNKLNTELRKEYGEEFFLQVNGFISYVLNRSTWKASNVKDGLVSCVDNPYVTPQVLIGGDAKTIWMLSRMMPMWCHKNLFIFIYSFAKMPAKYSMQ